MTYSGHIVREKLLLPFLYVMLTALLGGCGKLDAPLPGTYRAHVNLRGGEVPFELEISAQKDVTAIGMHRENEVLPLTGLKFHNGTLEAQLPDAAGTMHADIRRGELHGELRMLDQHGAPQVLPFAAELNKPYRFFEQPSTDNADISGYWLLEAISPEHFSAPVTLRLQQRFDAVDGQLHLPDGKVLTLLGQVHGDEVYLSALGYGRALLFKGKVNAQGELQGEVWANLNNVKTWAAKRMSDEQAQAASTQDEQVRRVALPWAIPAQ
jgi:hypothetical protein